MECTSRVSRPLLFVVFLGLFLPRQAASQVIDFEGLPDSTPVTTQFSGQGIIFEHTTVLTAGISLDEIDFPPHSGINVVVDDGGPLEGTLLGTAHSLGGYFTYITPITITAFDATGMPIASSTSRLPANFMSSGNPPNEFISVQSAFGIHSFRIEGNPGGTSFTMDDFSIQRAVPEPGLVGLLLGSGISGILAFGSMRCRRLHR